MKRMIAIMLCLSPMSAAGLAEDDKAGAGPSPLEIIKKVDAAAKAVKAVKYDIVTGSTGRMAARSPKVSSSVVMVGWTNGAPDKYLIDAVVTMPGSAESKKVTCGTDGNMYFIIDHASKIAYEDIDPAVFGRAGRILMNSTMIEFVHGAPFAGEIDGTSHELRGSKVLDGHDCYEVYVVYAHPRAPKATWFFSKKDFLPRGRINHYAPMNDEDATTTEMVTNLDVAPKLAPDFFKLKLPKGYTKTDDFAHELLR